jgi:hypothetical protein
MFPVVNGNDDRKQGWFLPQKEVFKCRAAFREINSTSSSSSSGNIGNERMCGTYNWEDGQELRFPLKKNSRLFKGRG